LNQTERDLASKYPRQAVSAYLLSWEAESACKVLYKTSDTNDESDACRHYMWAGMLVHKIGSDLAEKFLDAHEQDFDRPKKEKTMDITNNKFGLVAGKKLIDKKSFTNDELLEQFKSDLESKRLVILRSKIQTKKKNEVTK
jgi:hypothetical protein